MNASQSRILITLRDGGRLSRDLCASNAMLQRADGGVVCIVRWKTLDDLTDVHGYLKRSTDHSSTVSYNLTSCGWSVARSIRNKVTP